MGIQYFNRGAPLKILDAHPYDTIEDGQNKQSHLLFFKSLKSLKSLKGGSPQWKKKWPAKQGLLKAAHTHTYFLMWKPPEDQRG